MTFVVLIVDQFSGWNKTPEPPVPFEVFVQYVMMTKTGWKDPEVREVDEKFVPPSCTTTFRADANGFAEVWKRRWDSSG